MISLGDLAGNLHLTMNLLYPHSPRLPTLCLLLLVAGSVARGQITKSLMPATNAASVNCSTPATFNAGAITYLQGNDGVGKEGSTYFLGGTSRPDYDKIKIFIKDPITERIYLGGTVVGTTNVEMRILDPSGAIIFLDTVAKISGQRGYIEPNKIQAYVGPNQLGATCGYNALVVRPTKVGPHTLEFRNITANTGKYVLHPFDVVVGKAGAAVPGRIYSRRWHLTTTSASAGSYTRFYTYTPDSVVVNFDVNGIQPFGFSVNFNRSGAVNTGNLRADRFSNTNRDSPAEYPVFISPPDIAVWPNPKPFDFQITSFKECRVGDAYCISVDAKTVSQYNVYLDLDGVSGYQANGRDVYFPYRTSGVGKSCIPWDGRDNFGVLVAPGSPGTVIIEMLAGLTHFPIYDAEIHANGFNGSILRPSGLSAPLMFWDNTKLTKATPVAPGTRSNLVGCPSGCNRYTASDEETVNTWITALAATRSRAFTLGGVCDTDGDGLTDDVDQDDDNDGLSDIQEGQAPQSVVTPQHSAEAEAGGTATNPTRALGTNDGYTATLANAQLVVLRNVEVVPAASTLFVYFSSVAVTDKVKIEAWNGTSWIELATIGKVAGQNPSTVTPVSVTTGTFAADRFRLTTTAGTINLDAVSYQKSVTLTRAPDSDGDGVPDSYDLDSNNNGIPDLIEAGGTDVDGDGRVDGRNLNGTFAAGQDADGDGWFDRYDTSGASGGTAITLLDTDGDGVKDFLDLDDDNDGIPDLIEVGGSDRDSDGRYDTPSDADGDGLVDAVDPRYDLATGTPVTGTPLFVTQVDANADGRPDSPCAICDFDGDGKPNYVDLDSDNDGVTDVRESRNVDANNDGLADNGNAGAPLFVDANGDGLLDARPEYTATAVSTDGSKYSVEQDVDRDGRPNFLDIDSDNDGITDNAEAFATGSYLAPATTTSPDGLVSNYDSAPATHGGNQVTPVDTDNDGAPDYRDLDSDNDGNPDLVEGHDTDGDGVVNASDTPASRTGRRNGADVDGDGLDDGFDNAIGSRAPTNGNLTPSSHPRFAATQTNRDWRTVDLNAIGTVWNDTDNDGIFAAFESGISGATVRLLLNDTEVGTATTDANGLYRFLRRPAGTTYTVRFDKPSGYGALSARKASWSPDNDSDPFPGTFTTAPFALAANTVMPPLGAGFQAAPLPVVLTAFDVAPVGCDLSVRWTTASESDASHYLVEVSVDASAWTVAARAQARGTGSAYRVSVPAFAKTTYVRLTAVDLDGTAIRHGVVATATDCDSAAGTVTAYPNPSTGYVLLRGLDEVVRSVSLTDVLGRATYRLPVESQTIDLSGLPAGIYVARVGQQGLRIVRQ